MRIVLATLLALVLAACAGPAESDLAQLERFQASSPAQIASARVLCETADPVCVRLYVMQGAACQKLSEQATATAAVAREMRSCMLRSFQSARRFMPKNAPASERLQADLGLAAALKLSRDNATSWQQPDAELGALVPQLRAVPGGAVYAAYFAADSAVFRVLNDAVPKTEICRTLAGARADLASGGAAPADLAPSATRLRASIERTLQREGCA